MPTETANCFVSPRGGSSPVPTQPLFAQPFAALVNHTAMEEEEALANRDDSFDLDCHAERQLGHADR